MPFFITASSVQKATWFWITARVIQSILMLIFIHHPRVITYRRRLLHYYCL
jgi:uncharacterized integral membrane protein